jgi:hypothetical protein
MDIVFIKRWWNIYPTIKTCLTYCLLLALHSSSISCVGNMKKQNSFGKSGWDIRRHLELWNSESCLIANLWKVRTPRTHRLAPINVLECFGVWGDYAFISTLWMQTSDTYGQVALPASDNIIRQATFPVEKVWFFPTSVAWIRNLISWSRWVTKENMLSS